MDSDLEVDFNDLVDDYKQEKIEKVSLDDIQKLRLCI